MNTLARWSDSDIGYSFRTSPVAILAAVIAFVCVFCALFAGWVAPHNPFDLTTLELMDARLPPAWLEGGTSKFLLGTDDQGRGVTDKTGWVHEQPPAGEDPGSPVLSVISAPNVLTQQAESQAPDCSVWLCCRTVTLPKGE